MDFGEDAAGDYAYMSSPLSLRNQLADRLSSIHREYYEQQFDDVSNLCSVGYSEDHINSLMQLKSRVDILEQMIESKVYRGNFSTLEQEVEAVREQLLELNNLSTGQEDDTEDVVAKISMTTLVALAVHLISHLDPEHSDELFDLSWSCLTSANDLMPRLSHETAPLLWTYWGTYHFQRFKHLGEVNDIRKAIEHQELAVDVVRGLDHEQLHLFYAYLGNSYLARFEHSRDGNDLEQGYKYHSLALDRSSAKLVAIEDQELLLDGLAHTIQCQLEYSGELEQINSYIKDLKIMIRDAYKAGLSARASLMSALGSAYLARYERLSLTRDLDRGIKFLTAAVLVLPKEHDRVLGTVCALVQSLIARAEQESDENDAIMALRFIKLAQALVPKNDSFFATVLSMIAKCFMVLFDITKQTDSLRMAINYYDEVIGRLSSHPGLRLWSQSQNSLGYCYFRLFEASEEQPQVLARSMYHFACAAQLSTGHIMDRFEAACSWARIAFNYPWAHGQALCAYQTALDLVPRLASFGELSEQRAVAIRQGGKLATEGAALAIHMGNYELALVWLEQGRSVIFNQIIQSQTPLDALELHHPELAKKLRETSAELHVVDAVASLGSHEQSSLAKIRLAKEHDEALEEVRQRPGFQYFMRPSPLSALKHAAKDGPVVVVNVHESRCDALVINPGSDVLQHIPLPDLSPSQATKAHQLLNSYMEKKGYGKRGDDSPDLGPMEGSDSEGSMEHVLDILWHSVAGPVVDFLGLQAQSPDDPSLPRITWCATGALSFLPLHAAGCYPQSENEDSPQTAQDDYLPDNGDETNSESDEDQDTESNDYPDRIYHYAVSSYTPTLEALLSTSEPRSTRQCEKFSFLVVGEDEAPGTETLPGISQELDHINTHAERSAFEIDVKELDGPDATADNVLKMMKSHNWLHLACHAEQQDGDVTQSGFELYGGLLTLEKIAGMPSEEKGLAFLSACQTAKGDDDLPDEAIHLASAMLLAGYSSVIATMWAVKDEDAPFVADRVYEQLLVKEGMDHRASARALHSAVHELRGKVGNEFIRWVPYIHFGA